MILFPNCKINLGLRVIGKRPDGYHNIETIFYPLPLKDAAEIVVVSGKDAPEFGLTVSGISIPESDGPNLCRQAWELIKAEFPHIGPVHMQLLKAIPVGAGLGGGSSDAACTLVILNRMFNLNISTEKLMAYALQLGSDCPFFLFNKPCVATGRGEQMTDLDLDLKDYQLLLVDPGTPVSTSWAFNHLPADHCNRGPSLREIIASPVAAWKDVLINDFEEAVLASHAGLTTIKKELYRAGSVYTSLTGTGSCMYGIFPAKSDPDLRKIADHYKVWHLKAV